jgi:hypothetical protein
MFKGSAPWDWSPDRVREDLVPYMQGVRSFIPAWDSQPTLNEDEPVYYDPALRKMATVRGGTGVITVPPTASTPYGLAHDMNIVSPPTGIDTESLGVSGFSKFTVMMGVDLNGVTPSNSGIWGQYVSGGRFLWRVGSSRNVRIIIEMSGGSAAINPSAFALPTSGLALVAIRYDGTTVNQFLDGVKDTNTATTSGTVNAATSNYHIGADSNGSSHSALRGFFHGGFVWDRALTDDDVRFVNDNFFRFWEPAEPRAPLFGDLGAAPPAGAYPVSPFGHPLHGPFGGPI